ncbi:diguanylate cyclase [Guyparkeria sp. GHLCS8-2]|uniref:PAS domain-containing protein n=1 Tax=Guyparkeria halopsychrophila TaxID=3139421 RepID=UPI0037C91395
MKNKDQVMSHSRAFFPFADDTKSYVAQSNSIPLGDALPMGILVTDRDGKCLYSNKAYQKLCGWSEEEILGSLWSAVIHPHDQQEAFHHWIAALAELEPFMFETRMQSPTGEVIWTRRNAALLNEKLPDLGYVHTIEDISVYKAHEEARIKAEEQLSEEKDRAQVALNSIGDAVLSTDIDGRVVYMNVVAEELTGFSCKDAVGRPLSDVFHVVGADGQKRVADPARRAIQSNSIVALEANALLVAQDGSEVAIEDSAAPIRNRYGVVTGAVIVFHDARFSREATTRMEYLARHDALTSLYNRNAFFERFKQSLELARRHDKQIGLLFIDIDNFKTINDWLGHDGGDRLLVDLALKLKNSVRTTDTVCRYGGDEFVVLLGEIDQPGQAVAVTNKIRETANVPMVINGYEVQLQISIGVGVYPDDGATADELLKKSDKAMYHTKLLNKKPAAVRALPRGVSHQ